MKKSLKIIATISVLTLLLSACSVEKNQNGVERKIEDSSEASTSILEQEQTYIASTETSFRSGCKYKW